MSLRPNDPLWYKDAIIYELHVKSFFDGHDDGIGDFRGLIAKLPYLADLGVTALWLLPFYPSPLRDDGYDIADYHAIHPSYGTLADFREFLKEAHGRGIRVITELVLNHTSDRHAWFQRARSSRSGTWQRDFYVWSDTTDKYGDTRIIFKDFETSNWAWDPVARSYYWHRFYSHQPDLNFDNPKVHEALFRVVDFWFGMGVDGLRLDAVPYLYEREGTNGENLPETFAFLKKLRAHIAARYPDRLLLAEANQWPEDAVAYFGRGDLCHMAFHFPLMPRMFMATQMEDRFPIVDILEQTPAIPETCQWALFLRNHDELTLEMVTDEERDYMYNVYARDPGARINLGIRRRLAPLMGNNRRKIELMYLLLFTLPGTPIIYYGDEIGMGDNYHLGDRDGVRTPMQWSPDRNAGFSRCNPQRLFLPAVIDPEYHYEAVNVENQEANTSSLLWWMRRMIAIRRRHKAFGRGSFELRPLANPKVLAFIRRYEDETILVLVNLSRFAQVVEIGHPRYIGHIPVDLFSRNRFPAIKDSPYVLILGPYDTHLLLLQEAERAVVPEREAPTPVLGIRWEELLKGEELGRLEQVLPDYLAGCDWFGGTGRGITSLRVKTALHVSDHDSALLLTLIEAVHVDGRSETVQLPLYCAVQEEARQLMEQSPWAVIATLSSARGEGLLCDGIYSAKVREILFTMISRRKRFRFQGATLAGVAGRAMRVLLAGVGAPPESELIKSDRGAVSLRFDNSFFFKFYRRVEEGVNPEAEIGALLTDTMDFSGVSPFAGSIEYRGTGKAPITLGILQGYLPSHSDAWSAAIDEVGRYFERILETRGRGGASPPAPQPLLGASHGALSADLRELLGGFYQGVAELMGRRTGELHLALASRPEDAEFTPEPFNKLYQRSVYQSIRAAVRRVFFQLGTAMPGLDTGTREVAVALLAAEGEVMKCLQVLNEKVFPGTKIRIHGDYHLARLLYTGKDFIITDFEGEPGRSMSERRIKRSPLRDVAGMIRSFHSAAYGLLIANHGLIRSEDALFLEPWADVWYRHSASCFLDSYLATVEGARFVPDDRGDLKNLLDIFIIDRAVYELGNALDEHPERVTIPIRGILSVLAEG